MCIAIYKPAGKVISEDVLKTCYDNNKHGCGFAYINESYTGVRKVFVKKSLSFDTFLQQYRRAIKVNPDSPFLIHFRIKTHGPIDKTNCHPFFIDKDTVFIHNGIISGVGYDKDKSDTRLFNEKILQNLPEGWFANEAVQELIEEFIVSSKLVTMNVDGDIQIFNESKGNWQDGIWFSNMSWKEYKAVTTYKSTYNNTRQYNNQPKKFNAWSMSICDGCKEKFNLNRMSHYNLFTDVYESYCPDCEKDALDKGYVLKKEKINVAVIVGYLNTYDGYLDTTTINNAQASLM